ncbi:MAG: hypothetical protein ACHQIO_00745 [Nevskiales bacterium]
MIRVLLFLAYALCGHLSVLYSAPALEWASLSALAGGLLYPRLSAGSWRAWLGLAAAVTVCGMLTRIVGGRYIMYLPSVALPAVTLFGFAGSLLPGRTALVTRIAASAQEQLPPPLIPYTRQVTWLWTMVITAVLLFDLYLIFAGSREHWSEFANIYIYGILSLVFFGEYLYRRIRFRGLQQPGFVDYLRLLSKRPDIA